MLKRLLNWLLPCPKMIIHPEKYAQAQNFEKPLLSKKQVLKKKLKSKRRKK